jgi:hypothetical protein
MSRLRFVVSGVGLITALTLVPRPLHTQPVDLDQLDDATLQHDLEAELDDIYADFEPDGEFQLAELKTAMLEALGDEGDEGEDAEEEITFEQLETEMKEADTTLEDVLDEALAQADAVASSERQTWSIVRVSLGLGQRRGNGRTTPRQATLQAARAIIRVSNAR